MDLKVIFASLLILLFAVNCRKSEEEVLSENFDEIEDIVIDGEGITDIKNFLNTCPISDPFYEEIINDFEIRINGELVTEIYCKNPVSSIKDDDYSSYLIILQTLRVVRHEHR